MTKVQAIHINEVYCKGCGLCVTNCPADVLELSRELNAKGLYPVRVAKLADCTGCQLCELYCPDFAIAIEKGAESIASQAG